MTMSEHLRFDRADRYAFIATTIGLGEVVHSYCQPYHKYDGKCIVDITSTGVAIVRTEDDLIVTMYVLTISEAEKYFHNNVPMVLEAIIKRNMKKRLHILQNQKKF